MPVRAGAGPGGRRWGPAAGRILLAMAAARAAAAPPARSGSAVPDSVRAAYEQVLAQSRAERSAEMAAREIRRGEFTLRWEEKVFGKAPDGGRSLWISLHGGGGAPAALNDQQWRNQVGLYQPEEGIYVAPRAPTDAWDLWHQAHIDPLFDRLIENYAALRGVDPDRVYLLGYSAGGDGVWQLAPRMADRFAAAAMMAGHPNEASLLGLRNLPFAIFVGAEDAAYRRNEVAAEKTAELARLRAADPEGYLHLSRSYPDTGHWMNGRDREALPWMARFSRNPWPTRLVWFQDDVTHNRFYWLKLPEGAARPGLKIVAEANGQEITLTGDVPPGTRIRLSDRLVDLDAPVRLSVNGRPLPEIRPVRSRDVLAATLAERLDPASAACAEIVIE